MDRVVGAARSITPGLAEVTVATVTADLSTADGATAVVDGALAELGGIDILINNVGACDGPGRLQQGQGGTHQPLASD
ncbi:MAG: SDR family NAD(P)-dependent oxidoreductase [Acidimicrobiales bacterium]